MPVGRGGASVLLNGSSPPLPPLCSRWVLVLGSSHAWAGSYLP